LEAIKPGINVYILPAHRDGVEQITDILVNEYSHRVVESIHIVAHGAPGSLYLGSTELGLGTLSHYAASLQAWPSAEVFLYSCNVAAGDAGEEFIAKLHHLTSAKIYASTTKVGNAALGGNWDLNAHFPNRRSAESLPIFSAEALQAYPNVLRFSIGNRVWNDANGNGTIDGSEVGIDGVTVNLLSSGTVVATTTTVDEGYYLFSDLDAGDYVVEIAATNFNSDQVLANLVSSSVDEINPNDDVDSNDNGLGTTPNAATGIRSGVITLGPGTDEPLNESDLAPGGAAPEANLGDGLSEATGPNAPETFPGITNTGIAGRDDSVAILAGGNYTITSGAEAEGKVIVLGDFTVEAGSGFSDLGRVGVGSNIVPNDGEDALVVGGDITVDDAFTVGFEAVHNVVYKGALGGSQTASTAGTITQDTSLDLSEYANDIAALQEKSAYWATLPSRGTVDDQGFKIDLIGDGTGGLYVFNIDGSTLNPSFGRPLNFINMPVDGTTIIINVTGDQVNLQEFSDMVAPDGSSNFTFNSDFAANILWNIPEATEVTLGGQGAGQFWGSLLVANSNSVLNMNAPGHNGRVIAAGDIVQNRAGSEFHNYEFDPDVTLPIPPALAGGGSNSPDNEANLTADFGFTVAAANEAPEIDLDASDDSGASDSDYQSSFTAGSGAIAIADVDTLISDADGANIESATITLTNAQAGDVLSGAAISGGTGISASADGTTITLSGTGTLAEYQAAIAAITFNNTTASPALTPRTISVVVNDGTDSSNVATSTINVVAASTTTYEIGNRVWADSDDNGTLDGGESGIDGVVVNLLQNGVQVATTTTADGGYYLFNELSAGDYVVEIAAVNFNAGNALEGKVSSSVDETDPNDDVDNNDNGLGTTPDAATGIRSGVITLGPGTDEPLNESDIAPSGAAPEGNLGDGLSEATGPNAPETFPAISNTGIAGRDDSVSVLAGGDYTITAGAEAEGKIVVLGDFTVAAGSGFFDLGRVGVGSNIVPNDGEDALVVGGDITVDDGFNVGFEAVHNVVYGGSLGGSAAITPSGTIDQDASLDLSNYGNDIAVLQQKSAYWKDLPARGTVENNGFGTITLRGDSSGGLYVFNIDGNSLNPGFGAVVNFVDMPLDGSTVIINVTGTTADLNIGDMSDPNGNSAFSFDTDFAANILWNFPDATDVTLGGGAQFWGSVLVAQENSATVMAVPGHNGRFVTAGDLEQNRAGSEFHNYEFDPDEALPVPPDLVGGTSSNNPDNEANLTADFGFSMAAMNAAPVLDLDANDDSGASNPNSQTSFVAGSSPIAIATDPTIADDGGMLAGVTITLINAQAGDILSGAALPGSTGITASADGTTLTLSGTATIADYEAAIAAITFHNADVNADGRDRLIKTTVTDGTNNSNIATSTILFDADGDGASDVVESIGPNAGDANGDGIPDATQRNVASVINPAAPGEAYVTVEVENEDCGDITNMRHLLESDLPVQDPDADYFLGLTDFIACVEPGGTATVTVYWDQEYDVSDWTYRKFDGEKYVSFDDLVTYGTAVVGGNTVTTVTYDITDGGPGDADGIVNGIIVDPVGPVMDSDNDGVADSDDLDDDNDGILDTAEGFSDAGNSSAGAKAVIGDLADYVLFVADGSDDANWQLSQEGWVGDIAIDGIEAKERTSGNGVFKGTIYTNDTTADAWQDHVDQNATNGNNAATVTGQTALISGLESTLNQAFLDINALTATPGYDDGSGGISAQALNGLDTTNGVAETYVINITSDFEIRDPLEVTGDEGDLFILRWDEDADFSNGYDGQVHFADGGGIVPLGGLTAASFIHVAGDIRASGGDVPLHDIYPSYPEGPTSAVGGSAFDQGGFFTGYWLTTGEPANAADANHSVPYGKQSGGISQGNFVGGWYTIANKIDIVSTTSAVHVPVTVTAVTETDGDGDGIPDHLDLDSDNDGISDLVESGQDASVVDIDGDGVHNDTGETYTNGVSTDANGGTGVTPIDTDVDGVDDFLDLDSDNDGIPDTVEAKATVGYTGNDGDVSDNDVDGDGIIDIYDSNDGDGSAAKFGGSFVTPENTDGLADGADYIDTDSDEDGLTDDAESGLTLSGSTTNGIDDSLNATYADPDGSINAPLTDLQNTDADTSDVDFRSLDSNSNNPPNAVDDPATASGADNLDKAELSGGHNVNQSVVTGTDGTTVTVSTLSGDPLQDDGATLGVGMGRNTAQGSQYGVSFSNPVDTTDIRLYFFNDNTDGKEEVRFTVLDDSGNDITNSVTFNFTDDSTVGGLTFGTSPDTGAANTISATSGSAGAETVGTLSMAAPAGVKIGEVRMEHHRVTGNAFGVLIESIDYATTAAGTPYVTDEATPFSIPAADGVIGNDSDPDGDTLTVTEVNGVATDIGNQVTLPSGALLTLNADGSFDYDPNGQYDSLNAGQSATDTFTYTIADPDGATDTATVTVTINGLDNPTAAPVLDLDSDDSTAAGADYQTTFTEGGAAVAIGDTDTTITDADDSTIESATITLTNAQADDVLTPGATLPGGIVASAYDSTTGVISLSGPATLAEYQSAIAAITFENTNDNPDTRNRIIEVVVNDGTANSNVAISTIVVDLDTDGDGVGNLTDLDDDNDGILDETENPTTRITSRWIADASLRDGTLSNDTAAGGSWDQMGVASGTLPDSSSYSGAAQEFSDDDAINISAGADGTASISFSSGNVHLVSDPNFQVVDASARFNEWDAATPAGATITYTNVLDHLGNQLLTPSDIEFFGVTYVNGTQINDPDLIQVTNPSPGTFVVTRQDTSNFVRFSFRSRNGNLLQSFDADFDGFSDNDQFNHRFTRTIENIPLDSDGDGIANDLDLDSDNDGISDLTESGADAATLDPDNNGTIDGPQFVDDGTGATSAANNGLADAIETSSGTAGTGTNPRNSDTDTVADYLDLDSDGDTIPDATEARASGDYVAYPATIDGTADTDNDGILDIYDDNTTFGSTNTAFKTGANTPNADADDTADTTPD
ncbi:MAG: choice-of-anchor A family protein, partial [Cyanobacteria bacterium J06614_10]